MVIDKSVNAAKRGHYAFRNYVLFICRIYQTNIANTLINSS